MNFGLRLELNQLSDTDEHCPIGGLVGLTLMPARFVPVVEPAAGSGAASPAARSCARSRSCARARAAPAATRAGRGT